MARGLLPPLKLWISGGEVVILPTFRTGAAGDCGQFVENSLPVSPSVW